MIILGIDPGTARCGWGVVDKTGNSFKVIDYGCIETKKDLFAGERLACVYDELKKIINKYNPSCASVEQLFFAKNAKTVMSISEVRGVIVLLCSQKKLSFAEFTPFQVKQIVSGYGKADKKQVQKMVKVILKLDEIPKPDDAADGLALAIAYGQTKRYNKNI